LAATGCWVLLAFASVREPQYTFVLNWLLGLWAIMLFDLNGLGWGIIGLILGWSVIYGGLAWYQIIHSGAPHFSYHRLKDPSKPYHREMLYFADRLHYHHKYALIIGGCALAITISRINLTSISWFQILPPVLMGLSYIVAFIYYRRTLPEWRGLGFLSRKALVLVIAFSFTVIIPFLLQDMMLFVISPMMLIVLELVFFYHGNSGNKFGMHVKIDRGVIFQEPFTVEPDEYYQGSPIFPDSLSLSVKDRIAAVMQKDRVLNRINHPRHSDLTIQIPDQSRLTLIPFISKTLWIIIHYLGYCQTGDWRARIYHRKLRRIFDREELDQIRLLQNESIQTIINDPVIQAKLQMNFSAPLEMIVYKYGEELK
jgi:hypothetical protein